MLRRRPNQPPFSLPDAPAVASRRSVPVGVGGVVGGELVGVGALRPLVKVPLNRPEEENANSVFDVGDVNVKIVTST